jgi:flavin-dependent dehydrogenase
VDYGTDVGMCTGMASLESSGNGSNTAGGINGNRASGPSATNAGGSLGSLGGGTYTGMASADLANRAATQQRSQEMAAKRFREETLSRCLTERGYQQFALTAEQNAELAKFKHGSNEYHEYLYKLGADPAVLAKQSVSPAAAKK